MHQEAIQTLLRTAASAWLITSMIWLRVASSWLSARRVASSRIPFCE